MGGSWSMRWIVIGGIECVYLYAFVIKSLCLHRHILLGLLMRPLLSHGGDVYLARLGMF